MIYLLDLSSSKKYKFSMTDKTIFDLCQRLHIDFCDSNTRRISFDFFTPLLNKSFLILFRIVINTTNSTIMMFVFNSPHFNTTCTI